MTADRTSCSSPCISKQLLLNTTSAPVAWAIRFSMGCICAGLRLACGIRTSKEMGSNQNEAI